MLAHAIMQGAREIHIYGIHLATEAEYVHQRPNFEFLLGRVLGPGRWHESRANGVRRYETDLGVVVLPESSPLLQAAYQYGYQPRPYTYSEPIKWELHKIELKRARMREALIRKPWWWRRVPVALPAENGSTGVTTIVAASTPQQELRELDALAMDYQQQLERLTIAQQLAGV